MMILLDGLARSGTSLLARLMAGMLEPLGYSFYYEPFHHPSPAGRYENWEEMIGRVLAPEDTDRELETYITNMARGADERLFWKEIRLALKQDWLLTRFPEMKIVHLTRDILGVWSSHRREDAPEWMNGHRQIWMKCLESWSRQGEALRKKGIELPKNFVKSSAADEAGRYAMIWAMNESFVLGLKDERIHRALYEELCLHPLESLEQVARFLEIPFDEKQRAKALAHFSESEKSHDPSGPGAGLPGEAMPEIWRRRLPAEEIGAILSVAGEVRSRLGYSEVRGA